MNDVVDTLKNDLVNIEESIEICRNHLNHGQMVIKENSAKLENLLKKKVNTEQAIEILESHE